MNSLVFFCSYLDIMINLNPIHSMALYIYIYLYSSLLTPILHLQEYCDCLGGDSSPHRWYLSTPHASAKDCLHIGLPPTTHHQLAVIVFISTSPPGSSPFDSASTEIRRIISTHNLPSTSFSIHKTVVAIHPGPSSVTGCPRLSADHPHNITHSQSLQEVDVAHSFLASIK